MPSEYISKEVAASEAELNRVKWSMRHPLIVLVLLGVVGAAAMGLVALLAAA